MADANYKRKLTAILSADVAGYSRLMGDDEAATVNTLKSHRKIITQKVRAFNGRMSRRVALAMILTSAIIIGGLVSYYIYLYQSGKIGPGLMKKTVFPQSDKSAIAILPFVNLSEDPKQQYF